MIEAGILLSLKDEIKDIAGKAYNEICQQLDNGLNSYIGTQEMDYKHTKTFLINNKTVPFEKVYFPLTLYIESETVKLDGDLENLYSDTNKVSIIAQAGAGKTMILRHCFLSVLKQSGKIPVMIELRKLDQTGMSFKEFINNQIFNFDLAKNGDIYERLLKSGRFHFMLDGYDELNLGDKSKRTNEIEDFLSKYSQNYYLVTSRPGSFDIKGFKEYSVRNLSEKEVIEFVKIQTKLMGKDGELLRDKLIEVIKNNNNQNINAYLNNPLLLSMFILTFGKHPEIPSQMSTFYYNVFDTLYSGHDTTKQKSYIHDKSTKLERKQYEDIFKHFCFKSYFNDDYIFTKEKLNDYLNKSINKLHINVNVDDLIYDYQVAIGVLVLDGVDYIFPHRSLQEYFAAKFIQANPEEIKEKVIYPNLKERKSTSDEIIYNILDEIDYFCFSKYFVNPICQEVIKECGIQLTENHEEIKDEAVETLFKKTECTIRCDCCFDSFGCIAVFYSSSYLCKHNYVLKLLNFDIIKLIWLTFYNIPIAYEHLFSYSDIDSTYFGEPTYMLALSSVDDELFQHLRTTGNYYKAKIAIQRFIDNYKERLSKVKEKENYSSFDDL